jgi:hypothetical protein
MVIGNLWCPLPHVCYVVQYEFTLRQEAYETGHWAIIIHYPSQAAHGSKILSDRGKSPFT